MLRCKLLERKARSVASCAFMHLLDLSLIFFRYALGEETSQCHCTQLMHVAASQCSASQGMQLLPSAALSWPNECARFVHGLGLLA